MKEVFFSPYTHGFFRCAVATPKVKPAAPDFNLASHLELANKASEKFAGLVVFPELGLSGYSLQDIFHQQTLIEACLENLHRLVEESRSLFPLLLVGLPMIIDDKLFNCAAAVHRGELLGIVPKTWLPNHQEFYEKRHFCSANDLLSDHICFAEKKIPVGTNLIFRCQTIKNAKIAVEICEDLWSPIPPATFACMAGATIIANLSASNIVIGKADYRRLIVKSFSGKNLCSYVYSSAGEGESTTDLAWDGHAIIAENAEIIKENERFNSSGTLCIADVDVQKLIMERLKLSSFKDASSQWRQKTANFRYINFSLPELPHELELERSISRFPFIPHNELQIAQRCQEILNIQVQGLSTRLRSTGIKKMVIGVSGGLDSTLALLVACKAADKLGLPRKNVVAVTMPAFATSDGTRSTALKLMQALNTEAKEIDIIPSCTQMLQDLDHPFASGKRVYDVTFENVQAGERTSHLFRLANSIGGLVVGTGDLSELALGWCTYGVGDQMSHYNVNASVPKTLVQHLIRTLAADEQTSKDLTAALTEVLTGDISPELVPADANTHKLQDTQSFTGPYELQDFNLYYISRYGLSPVKVAYMCLSAWQQAGEEKYDLASIKKWLKVFLLKFFASSQFKRSCVPDSPKVGSGGSLSPRGDWRAPSDISADLWLEELEKKVP
jgi:NAD+ synthase (glutamine-hydrolysing)